MPVAGSPVSPNYTCPIWVGKVRKEIILTIISKVYSMKRYWFIILLCSCVVFGLTLTDVTLTSANGGPHGSYTATTDSCASCHRSHTAGASQLLVSATPGFCLTCHGATGLGADTNVEDGLYLERDSVTESPLEGVASRGLRGGGFVNAQMDTDQDGVFGSAPVTSSHDSSSTTIWGNGAIGSGAGTTGMNISCTNCHDPHGNSNYRILRPIPLGSGAPGGVFVPEVSPTIYSVTSATNDYKGESYSNFLELSQWCSQCHTRYHASSGSGHTDSGDSIFAYRHPTDVVGCMTCHVAHGSTSHMTGYAGNNISFPDGSTAATNDERSSLLRQDERLICYGCHVNSASGKVSDGSCQKCHNQPQGARRQIVDTGGDFALAHHHVNGIVQDTDCVRCHEVGAHTSGTVNLKNADSGATISFSSNFALEPFCLSCHDANGASGEAPFSDSVISPIIDQTAWASASHKIGTNAPQTCYGDCHQKGHASGLDNLLNPWTGTPGVNNVNQEEGFCFTCHDLNGPAATNIQAEFSLLSQHNISPTDPVGEFMECTTCHNPHLANGTYKLANPDTGATTIWTGTQEDFCLTCHDGAPPVGITFPASPAGTGYNKSTFVGSTHDNNIGPDGIGDSCRACHAQHGSNNLSTLLANYVIADYNQWTYGDGDYAMCWTCHVEADVIRSASGADAINRFEDLHDKHVRGEDTPCIVCHDAHAPRDGGEAGLINFTFALQNGYDIQLIGGRTTSNAFYLNGTQTQGYCYIRCHGVDHTPENYNR